MEHRMGGLALAGALALVAMATSAPDPPAAAPRDLASRLGVIWSRNDSLFLSIANPRLALGTRITSIGLDSLARTAIFRTARRLPAAGWPQNPVTLDDPNRGATDWYLLDASAGEDPPDGIAVVGSVRAQRVGKWIRADVTGDGRREWLGECAGFEGLNFFVREDPRGPVLWHAYYYLGYDIESDCPGDSLEPR